MDITDTPPEQRLYSFEEVVLFLDGLGCLPNEVNEKNDDAVRGWVEHMDAGDLSPGQAPPSLPSALTPSLTTAIKLGSAIVHFEEATELGSAQVDLATARELANDPEVAAWREAMDAQALLPRKRS